MADFTAGSVLTAAQLDTAFNAYSIRDVSTTTATLGAADAGGLVSVNNNSGGTVTIPLNATWAAETGTHVHILNAGTAGSWTVAIAGGGTYTGPATLAINESVEVVKYATDGWRAVKPVASSGGLSFVTSSAFSASSAVSINNCFSSTYANYRIMWDLTAASGTDVSLRMRLRVAGTDSSASSYYTARISQTASTITGSGNLTTSLAVGLVTTGYPEYASGQLDLIAPQLTRRTNGNNQTMYCTAAGDIYQENAALLFDATTSFDGFTLYPASGTITGTVRVYAYQSA